jgi:uncharacterized protein (TIGR00369 family)
MSDQQTEPAVVGDARTEQERLAEARWTLGGMEFFRKMIREELPLPPLPRLLGFRLVEVAEGRAEFAADPAVEFYNGLGSVHGGFTATLLDTALGCVVNTMAPPGKAYATVELKVTLVGALRKETGEVRCLAQTIYVGGRVATAEARIVDAKGRIYAHGTATCMAVDGPGVPRA